MPTSLGLNITQLASSQNPVIASGFGTGATLTPCNGTAVFKITLGTGANGGVLTMPQAANGWVCIVQQNSYAGQAGFWYQSAHTPTTVTLTTGDLVDGSPLTFFAGTTLTCLCFAF